MQIERSPHFVLIYLSCIRIADEAIRANGHHVERNGVSLVADVPEGTLDRQCLGGVRAELARGTVSESTHVPLRLEGANGRLHFFECLPLRAVVARPAS